MEDEQFKKFIEVIQKLCIRIPLIDAIQVPTYAKYLKDILNEKKPLLSVEVVKLTEECSVATLNQLPEKRRTQQILQFLTPSAPSNLIKPSTILELASASCQR